MLFIFDMGGVVTNTFEIDSLCKDLNLTSKDFYKICKFKNYNIWEDYQLGNICTNDFWATFNKIIKEIKKLSLKKQTKIIQNYDFSQTLDFSKIPEVTTDLFRIHFHPSRKKLTVELIEKLKEKHRVVCGTNTIQSHWENHLECGDYSFFNQTYPSNKIARIKPNVDFFETILKAENYSAEEAFFTDDKIENCEAAAKLGIKVHHFTSEEKLFEEWSKYI